MRGDGKLETADRRVILVLRREVEELARRFDLNQRQRLVVEQADRPFRARNGLLQQAEDVELKAFLQSGGKFAGRFDDAHAQARALPVGFDDQRKADAEGQLERPPRVVGLVHQNIGGRGDAALKQPLFRGRFAEGQPRGLGTAPRVEHVHAVEHALNLAVLPIFTVEREKSDVDVAELRGFRRGERRVETDDLVPPLAEGRRDGTPALQADFPLVRIAAAEDGNPPPMRFDKVDHPHETASSLRGFRERYHSRRRRPERTRFQAASYQILISNSRSTPNCSETLERVRSMRRKTSSDLAPALVTMKLACRSLISAAPTRIPFSPACSIRAPALKPRGFLKMQPADWNERGCVAFFIIHSLPHAAGDFVRFTRLQLERPFQDDELVDVAFAIAEPQVIPFAGRDFAFDVHHGDALDELADVAGPAPRVAAQGSAERARNARERFEPRQLGFYRLRNQLREEPAGTGPHGRPLDGDLAKRRRR